ncbi:MAG: YraN family protein [Isosphaeraceae bacterium]|nr:YraN family protein [Isosphaeraceae bacterium]
MEITEECRQCPDEAAPMNRTMRAFLNRLLGDRGECAAARHLRGQGFRVLLRGYRTARGEIDLIARDGPTVVFVEVKARRRGEPAEAVTPEKERRLTLAALQFLKANNLLECPARFDVVTLVWPDDRQKPTVEHYRNAFEPPGRGQFFR